MLSAVSLKLTWLKRKTHLSSLQLPFTIACTGNINHYCLLNIIKVRPSWCRNRLWLATGMPPCTVRIINRFICTVPPPFPLGHYGLQHNICSLSTSDPQAFKFWFWFKIIAQFAFQRDEEIKLKLRSMKSALYWSIVQQVRTVNQYNCLMTVIIISFKNAIFH